MSIRECGIGPGICQRAQLIDPCPEKSAVKKRITHTADMKGAARGIHLETQNAEAIRTAINNGSVVVGHNQVDRK